MVLGLVNDLALVFENEGGDDRASSPGLADEWMHHPISISNVQNEVIVSL